MARTVQRIFDMLWDAFVKAISKPAVVEGDSPLDMTDSVYDMLVEHVKGKLCDKGKVIPFYFATYIFEADLPTRNDLNHEFFGLVDEECETDDMDEFVDCVHKMYDCIRLVQQFFNTLPQLLEVQCLEGMIRR